MHKTKIALQHHDNYSASYHLQDFAKQKGLTLLMLKHQVQKQSEVFTGDEVLYV